MLVTRFEIHVSWRIVWREPGGLLKEGWRGDRAVKGLRPSTYAAARSEQRAPPSKL